MHGCGSRIEAFTVFIFMYLFIAAKFLLACVFRELVILIRYE